VLQDLNFMRRPTQYFPPFLGLQKEEREASWDRAGNQMQLQFCNRLSTIGIRNTILMALLTSMPVFN